MNGYHQRGANDDVEPTSTAKAVPKRSVFQIIRADHLAVLELFEQVETAAEGERTHLIERLVEELVLHTVAEEQTLYQRLRTADDMRDDVLEAEVEHSLIERLCNEIMQSSPDDELCDARLMVLRELVERHVEDEEEELLPSAESMIDDATALALGEEMMARKSALQAEADEDDGDDDGEDDSDVVR